MSNKFSKGDRVGYVGNHKGLWVSDNYTGLSGTVFMHDGKPRGGVLPDNLVLMATKEPAETPKTTKRYYVVNEIDTGRPLTLEEAKERAKEYVGSDGDEWVVVESILKFVPETIVKEVPLA